MKYLGDKGVVPGHLLFLARIVAHVICGEAKFSRADINQENRQKASEIERVCFDGKWDTGRAAKVGSKVAKLSFSTIGCHRHCPYLRLEEGPALEPDIAYLHENFGVRRGRRKPCPTQHLLVNK
jgi:hypothetical protein